jgi:thymidylate synthase
MYGIFQIRDNKLNFTVNMRSNDVILGLPTDVAFFATLQSQMLNHLKSAKYPDLELGTYTHIVNSFHIYERHFDIAKRMLSTRFKPVAIPKVKEDLINPIGEPAQAFFELFSDMSIQQKDPLFNWIQTNINL